MTFKEFLKSKYFIIQLSLAVLAFIFILWLSLKFLEMYTHHGRTTTVPDLEGLHEEEVETLLDELNLNYAIHDSIYDLSRKRGTVAAQEPFSGNEVKRGRTIYLTIVAELPEQIVMPELTDLSLRQALAILKNHGLEVGELKYKPNIAKNAVIEQKYNQGIIEPGTIIEIGTPIDLVLGKGLDSSKVSVPFFIGKTRHEALMEISRASLNLGREIYMDEDSINVKVYRQNPSVIEEVPYVNMGSNVDLYYRSTNEFDFDSYLDEIMNVDVPILYGKSPKEVRNIIKESYVVIGNEIFQKDADENNARVYKQEPDYFEKTKMERGSKINIWYKALEDFEEGDFEDYLENDF